MAFPISYMSKAIFSTPAKEKGTPIVSKRLRYFRSAFLFFCRIFYGAFTNSVILLLLQANSGLTSPGMNVSSVISEKKPPYFVMNIRELQLALEYSREQFLQAKKRLDMATEPDKN